MSLAENLLNSLDGTSYQNAALSDQEEHIKVGQDRVITVPNALKNIAVKGDKDIETVTFDCVRFWDGNDLSTFAIYLNYVLPDLTPGTYIPEKITTSDGDEFYHFDWEIKNNITEKSGKISFAVTAVKTKKNENGETVVDKQWSSIPNGDCSIALGLDISNVPDEEETPDVVAQLSAILERIHGDVDEWIKTVLVQTTGNNAAKAMSQDSVTKELNKKIDKTSISQSTGNSTTAVMSQKAATETAKAIANYNAKTDKNILDFSPELWEVGTIGADGEEVGCEKNRMRTAEPIALTPNTVYQCRFTNKSYKIEIYLQNANGVLTYYNGGWATDDCFFFTSTDGYYLKLLVACVDDSIFELTDALLQCGIIITEHKEDCFISATNNQLNTADIRNHVRITDEAPFFVVNHYGAIISHPIYVGGQESITLKSNSYQPNGRWIAFCKELSYNADGVVSVVYGLPVCTEGKSVVTIPVPQDAVFAFVTLRTAGGDENWVNDTIAFGNVATNDEYSKKGIVAINGELLVIDKQSGDAYDDVLKDEINRFNRGFVPFSVGSPNADLSFEQQYNRANVLFFTDSHIDLINPAESLRNVKDTIDFANNSKVRFDAVINGGDAITPFGVSKETAKANADKFFDELKKCGTPTIFTKGNHDTNDWYSAPSSVISDSDWDEMWLDFAEEKHGIVRQTKSNGQKSTWHYYDIADKKIRIIAVDVQDTDKATTDESGNVLHYGGVSWYISQEQMDWLVNVALNFDAKEDMGWGVIVVTHQDTSYSTSLTPSFASAIQKFFDVCVAFNNQTTYTSNYTFSSNSFYDLTINADFTRYSSLTDKPHIICWLIGHEHADKYETVNGINKIWLANGSATNNSSDDRLARVVGTATQNCFDVVNIDTVQRKIRCFRFGAGVNCYGVGGDRFLQDGITY